MDANDPRLREIWNQDRVPVVVRGGRIRPLLVRLPPAPPDAQGNYAWLRNERRTYPESLSRYKAWSIPKAWFEDTLRRALELYGAVYVIQPFKTTEKCAPACWNATGALCECSCMGANHGSGTPVGKWHVVSETFAAQIKERQFSCRLLLPIE